MFGTVTDGAARLERVNELKARRAELFKRLGQKWDQSDLHIGRINPDGSVHLFIKVAPEVSLVTLDSLGERLTSHLLQTNPRAWAEVRDIPAPGRKGKGQQAAAASKGGATASL